MLLDYLCNYKIIRKQNTKGAFTYYIITEGGRESLKCFCMIMAEGEGGLAL